MKYRQTHSVEVAAAKASISRATAYRLDKEVQLPSQSKALRISESADSDFSKSRTVLSR